MRSFLANNSSKSNIFSAISKMNQYNSLSKNALKKLYSTLDTVEISPASKQKLVPTKQGVASQQAIQSITHLQGKEVKELKATNNVLEFEDGAYYRFNMNGFSTILRNHGNGSIINGA